MSDPFLEEIERQAREEADAEREAKRFKYNPQVDTDPETGGVVVNVDLPDDHTPGQLIEAMHEAARKLGFQ